MIHIQLVKTSEEIKKCFPVMKQLRPAFSEDDFIMQVERQQKNGYLLVFLDENDTVKSLAGFHISESLSWGEYLYVDDFITDEKSRSKGFGSQVFDWLVGYAKQKKLDALHLDSGVQKERLDAHRFYFNQKCIFPLITLFLSFLKCNS